MNELIQASQLRVRRNNTTLIENVSLTIMPGEITTIIGPNGAGKTTLLDLLLGLAQASSGSIRRKPNLKIGYMPQTMLLNNQLPLTVARFMAMSPLAAMTIDEALEKAEVGHLKNQSMHTLSGGERQRVLLARALLGKPELLVLDEPAQGVDINGQSALYQLISQLRGEFGCAVLMVSHDLHWVMATTDHVICLNKHICCHGHPEVVSNDPAYIALFGQPLPENLAIYTHDHDHEHTIDGKVVRCDH